MLLPSDSKLRRVSSFEYDEPHEGTMVALPVMEPRFVLSKASRQRGLYFWKQRVTA